MKKYIIIILIYAHLLVKSQIPNPATDPNFYLDTSVSDEFNGTTLNTSISLRAVDFIELKDGFEVPNNTNFYLNINECY